MKTLVLALAVLLVGCHPLGSGPVITEVREVDAFRKVEAHSGLTVIATAGARHVAITANEDLMPHLQAFVRGDTLVLQLAPAVFPTAGGTRRVELSNDVFERVEASGGSSVTVPATPVDTFEVATSGGSDVSVTDLASTRLSIEASGGSSITVRGAATDGTVVLSGGSDVHLRAVPLSSLAIDVSGGCTLDARVAQSLTGEASGGSTVTVVGSPDNRVQTSGGSSVRLEQE